MAKAAGYKTLIKKGATTIAGVRVTGISVDNTPIDVTDNDSTGLQTLLADSAFRAMTLTVSGVESDHVLRDIALNPATSQLITDLTFVFGNSLATNDVLACDWYMSNYKEDNDYKDAGMFSATFTSSGTWTRS